MKFLISGYYGAKNLGDEAVLSGILAGLKKHFPQASVTVLSSNPEETQKTHGVQSVFSRSPSGILRAFSTHDVLLSGGGTLLQDATSLRSLLYYTSLIFSAKVIGKKVVISGQGIGPLNSRFGKLLSKKALNAADLVLLRDKGSCEAAKSLGIKQSPFLSADPAFLLDAPQSENISRVLLKDKTFETFDEKTGKKVVLGVCVRKVNKGGRREAKGGSRENLLNCISESVSDFAKKHDSFILLLPMQHPQDYLQSLVLRKKLISAGLNPENIWILPACPVSEFLTVLSKISLLITVRLHGAILSSLTGTPFLALSYDPKVSYFVQELGLPQCGLNILGLESETLFEYAGKVFEEKEDIKRVLEKKVADLKRRAAEGFVRMAEVC